MKITSTITIFALLLFYSVAFAETIKLEDIKTLDLETAQTIALESNLSLAAAASRHKI